MKSALSAILLIAAQFGSASAQAGNDVGIERLATCKDSWLDWKKSEPGRLKSFGDHFRSTFSSNENDPFYVPKSSESIFGLRILQAYPDNVGMGVGFSVLVDAPFDKARKTLEASLGKPLAKCDNGDGMKTCALEIGAMRTVMLMAEDSPKSTSTLLGCYYFYEK